MIEYISKLNNLSIQITLDGIEQNHDKYRVDNDGCGTFKIIYSNLLKLYSTGFRNIIVRFNVAEDLDPYYKLIDKMQQDGMSNIYVSCNSIFDGQQCIHCVSSGNINELSQYAVAHGFLSDVIVHYGPCTARCKYGMAIDEDLNVYICPGSLYQRKIGSLTSEGEMLITDMHFRDNILKMKDCVNTCEYGPLCFGGCVLKNSCRKKEIKQNLPYFIENKCSGEKNNVAQY